MMYFTQGGITYLGFWQEGAHNCAGRQCYLCACWWAAFALSHFSHMWRLDQGFPRELRTLVEEKSLHCISQFLREFGEFRRRLVVITDRTKKRPKVCSEAVRHLTDLNDIGHCWSMWLEKGRESKLGKGRRQYRTPSCLAKATLRTCRYFVNFSFALGLSIGLS